MNKKAFTLAEVLITLGIIGVVAALTMPSLVANYKEKQTVVKLKKVYSVLSQAYESASNDNGTPDNWNLIAAANGPGAVNFMEIMAPYFRISKKCGLTSGCFPNVVYRSMLYTRADSQHNFNSSAQHAKFRTSDGTSWTFYVYSPNCSTASGNIADICAQISVDINGNAGPNAFGRDFFSFYVTKKYGIVPGGSFDMTGGSFGFTTSCLYNKTTEPSGNGFSCTGWAIVNENMDYLHCSGLAWTGKTKCD